MPARKSLGTTGSQSRVVQTSSRHVVRYTGLQAHVQGGWAFPFVPQAAGSKARWHRVQGGWAFPSVPQAPGSKARWHRVQGSWAFAFPSVPEAAASKARPMLERHASWGYHHLPWAHRQVAPAELSPSVGESSQHS